MRLDKENYRGTIGEASYDTANEESLIENDDKIVYLLDEFAKDLANEYEIDTPSTCDSLCNNKDEILVIEFKNREYKKVTSNDKREIRKKAYQTSELLLNSVFRGKTAKDIAEQVTFMVVFKNMDDKEKSYRKFSNKLNKLANGDVPEIRCRLGKFKGTFYKDVCTIGKDEFEKIYLPNIGCELPFS